LLRDRARCASLGDAGRARVEADLTLTAMIDKTGALYDQVLSSGRSTQRLRAA